MKTDASGFPENVRRPGIPNPSSIISRQTEAKIVATLSRQLSWSHFVNLLPLKTEQARQFYAGKAASQTRSLRELRQQIERKAFERTELASLQVTPVHAEPVEAPGTSPAQVFKDPYFLDFLGRRRLVAIELKLGRFKAAHKGHPHSHRPHLVRRIQPRTSGTAANSLRISSSTFGQLHFINKGR